MNWSDTAMFFIVLVLLSFVMLGFVRLRKFLKTEAQKEQEQRAPERIKRMGLRVLQSKSAQRVHNEVVRLIRLNNQLRQQEPERFDGGALQVIKADETNGSATLMVYLQSPEGPNVTLASISFDFTVSGSKIVAWYGERPTPYTYKMDEVPNLIRLLENFLPAYGYQEVFTPPPRLITAGATA